MKKITKKKLLKNSECGTCKSIQLPQRRHRKYILLRQKSTPELEHWLSYLFHRDKDDIARHYLDDVDLQEPPDEELQFVKILQELQKEDGQAVDHQVPLILQV